MQIQTLEAENRRLIAALELEAKARQEMAESFAQARSELINLQARTCCRMAVPDSESPGAWLIVYSTLSGIRNLERVIDGRFEDGRALGRAESADLIEGIQATLAVAG